MNGAIVVATSQDGQVQGCEVDFGQSKVAGMDVFGGQVERAQHRLIRRIIEEHCSIHMAAALIRSPRMEENIWHSLRGNGWQFTSQSISLPSDDQETME